MFPEGARKATGPMRIAPPGGSAGGAEPSADSEQLAYGRCPGGGRSHGASPVLGSVLGC